MIGDWVYAKVQVDDTGTEPVFERTPKRVTDLTNSINGIYVEGTSQFAGAEIEPISLTPEILEKNFGKPYPRGGFHNYRMEKDETIAFVIEDRRVSAAPDNRVVFCRVPGTYICDVNYVHELQHALRLCGIDKDIEL